MPSSSRIPLDDKILHRVQWDDLDLAFLRRMVEIARDEDLSGLGLREKPSVTGDVSSASLTAVSRNGAGDLIARRELVVCGLKLIPLVLSAYGSGFSVQSRTKDGVRVQAGTVLATLHGDPRLLLSAERVLLNFIQRLSGIATHTQTYVQALGKSRTRLLDTRKTTPGWRMLEKYAVACGGGWNHRLGLFDRVMLKDNHLAVLGETKNISAAVAQARRKFPELPVEIEVDRLDQIPAVLDAGADIILLDNFSVPQLRRALEQIGGRAFTEASGGITLRLLPRLAALGLDFISSGALVHHSVWVDIGLDWRS